MRYASRSPNGSRLRRKPKRMTAPTPGQYLLEFAIMGRYMKATAIDPRTGEEASITADPRTPRGQLGQMAVRKLQRQQGLLPLPKSASDDDSYA